MHDTGFLSEAVCLKNGILSNFNSPTPDRQGQLIEIETLQTGGEGTHKRQVLFGEALPSPLSYETMPSSYRVGQFHFALWNSVAPPRVVSPNSF
jgi:hypothetical protein